MPLALSQIPQGFNYQAIARDGTGNILPNTSLQAMMYVQSESTGGTIFWKELHASITTNSFGLFTLVVGTGTRQTESTVATFNLIDWSITPKFLKTEIYYSGSWKNMGTSQLMTVPYAMTSGDIAGTVDKLAVKGTTTALDEALFEVKNKNGQTIFAVYNEGVRIYVDDGAKGPKGGFAVGGFDMTKATKKEYFIVCDDSIRIYLDDNPLTKGTKGGFAVGGYDMTKAIGETYLRVTRDSTRIYVNQNATKSVKGGFAVGGFDGTKGAVTPFTSLTPDNYLIGHESGKNITTGKYNSVLGYQGGMKLTTGGNNVFLGYQSGVNTKNGDYNVFLGHKSGFKNRGGVSVNGDYNVFIGAESGSANTIGYNNVYIGFNAGLIDSSGFDNVYMGYGAGAQAIASATYQNGRMVAIGSFAGEYLSGAMAGTFVGWAAGRNTVNGQSNTFLGYEAGVHNIGGSSNIYIGAEAGRTSTGGNLNTMVGTAAGYSNTGSSNVYIGYASGNAITAGANNTIIGTMSGQNRTGGVENIILGYAAGMNSGTGNFNVFIGTQAGYNNTGSHNVFLGNNAGLDETGSDLLIIDNSSNASPLIYGEFNTDKVKFNASVNIRDLFILDEGTIAVTEGATVTSAKSNVKLTTTAAITLSSATPVANGAVVGQLVILRGSDDTNSVTINDSGNVRLTGNIVLGNMDTLMLMWDGTAWIQISFSNN
jgi:hypothetical protein